MLLDVTANDGQRIGTLIDLASDTNYITHKAASWTWEVKMWHWWFTALEGWRCRSQPSATSSGYVSALQEGPSSHINWSAMDLIKLQMLTDMFQSSGCRRSSWMFPSKILQDKGNTTPDQPQRRAAGTPESLFHQWPGALGQPTRQDHRRHTPGPL